MSGLFCGTLVVLVAGPIALNAISWRFYFVLVIPPAIQFICIYLFFPETKRRSLEDIAEVFGDRLAVHYYQQSAEERAMYAQAELEMDEKKGVHAVKGGREVEDVEGKHAELE